MQTGPVERRRHAVTPLGIVGVVLSLLVVIDVAAWLWGQTLGAGLMWWLLPFFGGLTLVLVWFAYVVAWEVRRRRLAWHLLIIPGVGLLGLVAAFTGLPYQARWAYDEPRLTRAAKSILADPRPEFSSRGHRRIGSQTIYHVEKNNGVVILSFSSGSFSVETLEYRPDGSAPEFGGEVPGNRLSNGWWLVMID